MEGWRSGGVGGVEEWRGGGSGGGCTGACEGWMGKIYMGGY